MSATTAMPGKSVPRATVRRSVLSTVSATWSGDADASMDGLAPLARFLCVVEGAPGMVCAKTVPVPAPHNGRARIVLVIAAQAFVSTGYARIMLVIATLGGWVSDVQYRHAILPTARSWKLLQMVASLLCADPTGHVVRVVSVVAIQDGKVKRAP